MIPVLQMRKMRSTVGDPPTDSNLSHESESHTLPTHGLGSLRQGEDRLIRHTESGCCRGPRLRRFSRHQALYSNLEGRRKVSTQGTGHLSGQTDSWSWAVRTDQRGIKIKDERLPRIQGSPTLIPRAQVEGEAPYLQSQAPRSGNLV